MATRVVIPEEPRGIKRKNGEAEDFKNKRICLNMGKIAIAPAIMAKPPRSRPMIRSFGAQLLVNAQEAAKKSRMKAQVQKPTCPITRTQLFVNVQAATSENGNVMIGKGGAATSHPKEEEPPKSKSNASAAVISPQKSVQKVMANFSLSSILRAFTKVASGVFKKPKDVTVDIDAADMDDELAVVEYIAELYNFYKLSELDEYIKDYMDSQKEVNRDMRAALVDWLVEVHQNLELAQESLFLAVNTMDRFLSVKMITRRELRLVGFCSLLIACKYEQLPKVRGLADMLENCSFRNEVLQMEKEIVLKLNWNFTLPTPYVFLLRYIKASIPADKEMENMAFFYAELGLTMYTTAIKYTPSLFSASAVYAARCTLLRSPLWTETLKQYTGYSEYQLVECAKLFVECHMGVEESKLNAICRKYSNPGRAGVSLFHPAKI